MITMSTGITIQVHPSTLEIFIQRKNHRDHHTNSLAWDRIRHAQPHQRVERLQSRQRGGRPDHPSPRPWQHVALYERRNFPEV